MDTVVAKNIKRKVNGKWYVYSEDGKKKLGGPYDTEKEADERIGQVEYFKKHPKNQLHGFQNIAIHLKPNMVRYDNMADKEYLVVPMVMLTPGVHEGSAGAYLYTEDELSKRPGLWNMKPVVVYHPDEDSACDPTIINSRGIGIIMNSQWDTKDKALKAEAWLEKSRVDKVDKRVSEAIDKLQMMELSTGLFADSDEEEGEWCGEKFKGTLYNFGPDHLAVLPDQKGACSVEDGAGFLRNASGEKIQLSASWTKYFNDLGANALRSQLQSLINVPGSFDYVEDVFIEEKYFIYSTNDGMFSQDFEINDNVVSLKGSRTEVVRVISYEEIKNQNKLDERTVTMAKEKIVFDLIANKATAWVEADKTYLLSLDEKVLEKMIPVPVANEEKPPATTVVPPVTNAQNDLKPAKVQTTEEYIAAAPPEIQSVLKNSMDVMLQQKTELVERIMKAPTNQFTKEFLMNKDPKELAAIAALVGPKTHTAEEIQMLVNDFTGLGEVSNAAPANQPPLPLPTMTFDRSKK